MFYGCVHCNSVLFTNRELIDHAAQSYANSTVGFKASFSSQNSQLSKCAAHFVRQTEWMKKNQAMRFANSGFIECPNTNCSVKLG